MNENQGIFKPVKLIRVIVFSRKYLFQPPSLRFEENICTKLFSTFVFCDIVHEWVFLTSFRRLSVWYGSRAVLIIVQAHFEDFGRE